LSGIEEATAAVARLTGDQPVGARRIGSAAFEVRVGERTVFAKTTPTVMPGAITAEGASLAWLAATETAAIPTVHGYDDEWLILDYLQRGEPDPRAAEDLGRDLARLHAAGADGHGAPPPAGPVDAWIGLAPMRNEIAEDWPTFYATYRVEPYLREAVDSGVLTALEGDEIARVCRRLDELAGPPEPPARLHGDLWTGNVHFSGGRAWLVDPAAHGGHRETDLAMLRLFGCPHLDRIIAAYQEVNPLADGWRDRVALHQLFPLLVHAVLFGRSYAMQAVGAARDLA
jgi:fructosamine-3-kinase